MESELAVEFRSTAGVQGAYCRSEFDFHSSVMSSKFRVLCGVSEFTAEFLISDEIPEFTVSFRNRSEFRSSLTSLWSLKASSGAHCRVHCGVPEFG